MKTQQPATREQGLYDKFKVKRTDGKAKHKNCRYFVIDIDCDPFAKAALTTYAKACEDANPVLAEDLRGTVGWQSKYEPFQLETGTWAMETFPWSTFASTIKHLQREVAELDTAFDVASLLAGGTDEPIRSDTELTAVQDESADCLLLLLSLAHRAGFDLFDAARKKLKVNKDRRWGERDAEGVVEHLRGAP